MRALQLTLVCAWIIAAATGAMIEEAYNTWRYGY